MSTPTTPHAPDPSTPPDSAGTAQEGPAGGRAGGGPAGEPLLRLSGVSKIYGDLHALDNVSLEIPRGQWVSIVGPSGSGKTTLMNIVGAMDTATKGTVALDGHDISDLTGDELTEIRCRTIGLVFQQFHLIGHLTALENVMVAQYYHSMPDEKEAMEALDRVGLADRATHLPRQLSGGEQQRVCVARALINYPKLVLADEPTGNLDETNEEIVLDLFAQLHKDGTTLMVVTHDALVAEQGQREIRLDHGRVVKETWHDHDFASRDSGLAVPASSADGGAGQGPARSGKDKVR
ncbi:ABC transporter, ATP-binding protein [Schaalia georgiae F0490]|uniref:ABC transporter, ATP-binding protein n=1 Tax=Schaalia georgiae F0490 TaxID=1125717 RepID=J0NKE3_9ACTO|nr:ABC transporter ATP-binding protein [Schaalia georgiae]EJF45197.1 ABC transporter, ATP-binding protein [Schaalia georgiae F0490]